MRKAFYLKRVIQIIEAEQNSFQIQFKINIMFESDITRFSY